jgi:hypothetical protein
MNIFPALRYKDASAAIDLLGSYDGGGWLGGRPMEPLASSISVYVVVGDPDAHFARAKKVGATIVREITDEDYGSASTAPVTWKETSGPSARTTPTTPEPLLQKSRNCVGIASVTS